MKRVALSLIALGLLLGWTLVPFACVFGEAWFGNRVTVRIETAARDTGSGLKWLRSPDGLDVRTAIRNSLAVATLSAVVVICCGVPAGYVLGARWKVRAASLTGLVLGRALPSCAVVMPILSFCLALGISGSPLVLIVLHSTLALPLIVALVARQPWDRIRLVEQAAYLDGAGPFRVKLQLWIAALFPTIVFGFIFAGLESWKEFGFAVMLMRGDSATLPVVMAGFESIRGVNWQRLATTLLIAVAPSLGFALYIATMARRHFKPGGSRSC
jgi:ABC-type glycerol-3-phosphate transport system permease component